jgi:energy-coupling factor transporter ATP-binding protein EcfA2/SAM-dependent methyltransferase
MNNSVKDYYTRAVSIYRDIFGANPHFGYYPVAGMELSISLDDAQSVYVDEFADYIHSTFPLHKHDIKLNVLELCCGQGLLWKKLEELGVIDLYIGVDFTDEYLDEFRETIKTTCDITHEPKLICTDISDYLRSLTNKDDEGFDLIIIQDSFYHLDRKQWVLDSIENNLRDGGLLFISDLHVDSRISTDDAWHKHFVNRQGNSKPTTFTSSRNNIFGFRKVRKCNYEIEQMVESSGLEIIQHVDMTQSMELTYKRAIEDAVAPEVKTKYTNVIDAFKYLHDASKNELFRLGWWAVMKPYKHKPEKTGNIDIAISQDGFKYDGKSILLRGGALTIGQGEYVVIIGKTGSGKSSLLKMIAGAHKSDNVKVKKDTSLRVAYVEQNPSLVDGVILEKLLGLIIKSSSNIKDNEISQKVYKILAKTKLLHLADHLTTELSGGQKQRAALGAALATSPDVLLVDEPVSSQDRKSRKIVLGLLEEFSSCPKRSVVHVTHRYNEIRNIDGKTIYEIANGRIFDLKQN